MQTTESAVRSRLKRKGYSLAKSRSRTETDPNFGCFHIFDPFTNTVVDGCGSFAFMMSLEEADEASKAMERNWRM